MGLRESAISASPALLSSCNSIFGLASVLLSVDIHQLSFPDENDAATILSDIFSDHSLFAASQ